MVDARKSEGDNRKLVLGVRLCQSIWQGKGFEHAFALIEDGAELNVAYHTPSNGNLHKMTPLLLAVKHCDAGKALSVDLIERLIKEGADVFACDSYGATALHIAAEGNKLAIAKVLVRAMGCQYDPIDAVGRTPLHYAAEKSCTEMVNFLLGRCELIYMPDNSDVSLSIAKALVTTQQAYFFTQQNEIFHVGDTGHKDLVKRRIYTKIKQKKRGKTTALEVLNHLQWHERVEDVTQVQSLGLLTAADEHILDEVKEIKRQRANPNILSRNRSAPLHLALKTLPSLDDISTMNETVRALLEMGAYPNQMNFSGDTPLHLAVKSYDTTCAYLIIEYLQRHDLPLNQRNHAGRTPLCYASRSYADMKLVRHLAAEDDMSVHTGEDGITPLHEAASAGRLDVVEFLVGDKGMKPRQQDFRGYDALYAAMTSRSIETIAYLFKHSPQLDDAFGNPPIFFAAREGKVGLVRIFYQKICATCPTDQVNYEGQNILHILVEAWAALSDNDVQLAGAYRAIFEELTQQFDFEMDCEDGEGNNLIMTAVRARARMPDTGELSEYVRPGRRLEVVNFLIDRGVSVRTSNLSGDTPLARARYYWGGYRHTKSEAMPELNKLCELFKTHHSESEVTLHLQRRGIETCVKPDEPSIFINSDLFGETGLNLPRYTEEERLQALEGLLAMGASANISIDKLGRTPIFFAMQHGFSSLVNCLRRHGAMLNIADRLGHSPLYYAPDFAVDAANVDPVLQGQSAYPLHTAAQMDDADSFKKLVRYGADVNAEDDQGLRPLDNVLATHQFLTDSTLISNYGAVPSYLPDFSVLQKVVREQRSPVIWLADLTVSYGSKQEDKRILIPAEAAHKKLRKFENYYRRFEENERMRTKHINDLELLYNRGQGVPFDYSEKPNFAVFSLTFVVREKGKDEQHKRRVLKPVFVKAEKAGDTRSVCHINTWVSGNDARSQFELRCERAGNNATAAYEAYSGVPILLDARRNYQDKQKLNHSEQAFYEYLRQEVETIIDKYLLLLSPKCEKLYAMIVDVHTTREMCGNCVDRTIDLQTDTGDSSFLRLLHNALQKRNIQYPKTGVRILSRVSSDMPSDGAQHVPSPDDGVGNVPVLIREGAPQLSSIYDYEQIRKHIDIKDARGAILLASPQAHTRQNFASDASKPETEDYCTIFTSNNKVSKQSAVYNDVFSTSR